MMSWPSRWRADALTIAAAALTLGAAGIAHAAEPFVIAGTGGRPPANAAGGLATERPIAVNELLAEPDGGIVFTGENRVVRVDAGGALTIVAGAHRSTNTGDGGPARAALLADPYAIARDAAGALLVVADDRLRRITPDGLIATVAGGGPLDPPPLGEPIPALSAKLDPGSVTVTADRRVLLTNLDQSAGLLELPGDGTVRALPAAPDSDERCDAYAATVFAPPAGGDVLLGNSSNDTVCRIDDGGRRSVLMAPERPAQIIAYPRGIADINTLPDGSVLVTDVDSDEPSRLLLIAPGATHATQIRVPGDGVNIPLTFTAEHTAVAADGGLIVADGSRILYLPPAHPGRLALRFEPDALRASAIGTRIGLRATLPGSLRLEIGKRVMNLEIPAGRRTVTMRGRLRPGLYRIHATLRSPSGAATSASTRLVLGGRLTNDALRGVLHTGHIPIAHTSARPRDESVTWYPDRCRRWSDTRVDCRVIQAEDPGGSECSYMAAVLLGPDGRLSKRTYRCAKSHAHVFAAHPHWRRPVPIDMFGDVLGEPTA